MNVIPTQNAIFDDAVTLAMGEAFDRTCKLLRIMGDTVSVREIIAKRIIEAAKNGEGDPARLYEQALIVFGIVVSVGDPVPAYA
jgi:tartrate dehydratase beta subunit/fumarate hydratase class I family protein